MRKGLLYAGGEFGMYVSFDDGAALAVAAVEPARHAGHRSRRVPGRPGALDQRSIVLDPGRRHAASRTGGAARSRPRICSRRATRIACRRRRKRAMTRTCSATAASPTRATSRRARASSRHQLGEEPPDGAIIYASFPQRPDRAGHTVDSRRRRHGHPHASSTRARRAGKMPHARRRPESPQLGSAHGSAQRGQAGRRARTARCLLARYQVKLTVGTKSQTAALSVLMDPRLARVHVTTQDLQKQYDLLAQIKDAVAEIQRAAATIRERRARSPSGRRRGRSAGPVAAALNALERELVGAAEGRGGRGGGRGGAQPLLAEFTSLYNFVAESEDKPTAAALARWTAPKQTTETITSRVTASSSSLEGRPYTWLRRRKMCSPWVR